MQPRVWLYTYFRDTAVCKFKNVFATHEINLYFTAQTPDTDMSFVYFIACYRLVVVNRKVIAADPDRGT